MKKNLPFRVAVLNLTFSTTVAGILLLVSSLLVTTLLQAQVTRYVTSMGTNASAATATSWTEASSDLQAVINASSAGDQVWVKAGTYKPGGNANTDRNSSFGFKNGVAVYGGFAGTESELAQRPVIDMATPSTSILSGDIGVSANNSDNSYHVLFIPPNSGIGPDSKLDGFVVSGGNANGSEPNGGGLCAFGAEPTIVNCRFTNNSASNSGGGVYATGYGLICTFTNCSFSSNISGGTGGGLSLNDGIGANISNCVFQGNATKNTGGGMYNSSTFKQATLSNCNFSNNTAGFGGGIGIAGSPLLTGCNFNANDASLGGAAYIQGGSPKLSNCSFTGNTAQSGGGVYNGSSFVPDLRGCTFTGNSAKTGGGMFNSGSRPFLQGCTFTGNTATNSGAGMFNAGSSATIETSDFNGNKAGDSGGGIYNSGGSPLIRTCYFATNKAYRGAGMANTGGATTTILNCSFEKDSADNGGGIYNISSNAMAENCGFMNNIATADGGAALNSGSAAVFNGCTFNFNKAASGGAVANTSSASPTLTRCIFSGNTAFDGGGMYNVSFSSPKLVSCRFLENTATKGAGMQNDNYSSPSVVNCEFVRNSATNGGAFYNVSSSSPVVINCSIAANQASAEGGALYNLLGCAPSLHSSVIWGNGNKPFFNNIAVITASYTLFDAVSTGYSGSNNLITNVLPFVAPDDPRLFACSPAVNAGNPATVTVPAGPYGATTLPQTDVANNPRIISGRVDMGAHEFQSEADCPPVSSNWIGTVSNAWENGANWSTGLVPDGNTIVQVNGGTPFNPRIASMAMCKSITLANDASLTVAAGYKLDITGSN